MLTIRMPLTDRIRVTASLLQAGRQWRRLAQEVLVAHDISDAQASPLIHLGRLGNGVRQVTLAGHVGIEGPSLVRLLDQLEAAGLLERRDDPEDRRAKTLWLTPEGRRLVQRIERVLKQLRDKVLREVSDEEIAAALRVFQAIEAAGRDA